MNGSELEIHLLKVIVLNNNFPSKKILAICMLDSIHTVRWLEQYENSDIQFHLIASTPNRIVHSKLLELISRKPSKYVLHYSRFYLPIMLWGLDLIFRNQLRASLAERIIKGNDLDTVHAIELNHAGYIAKNIPQQIENKKLKFISSVWGSDIFWFSKFKIHRKNLSEILSKSSLLISECKRDLELAKNLGFNGRFIQSSSLFGFSEKELYYEISKPSTRKVILIKGYESFVGRASLALKAIDEIIDELSDFQLVIYSANRKTKKIARKISKDKKISIKIYKKRQLTAGQMLELFASARVHIGISLSDGVPASLLESMVSGTFPIQTNTSCGEQWIENGKTGLLIDPDVNQIKSAILLGLKNNKLVDEAMIANRNLAKSRLNKEFIATQFANVYQ